MRENSEVSHNSVATPVSGGKEVVEVSSGLLLVIDQFMLGNQQFLNKVWGLGEEPCQNEDQLREIAEMYGGCLLGLTTGFYGVFRDPEQVVMALVPMGKDDAANPCQSGEDDDCKCLVEADSQPNEVFDFHKVLSAKGRVLPLTRVFVDTRCLVFIDPAVLSNKEVIGNYQQLRKRGQDKQARDLLRSLGGAVRYGFNRYGDELGAFSLPESGIFALWPDVIDY